MQVESLQKLQAENQQSAERLAAAVQEGGKNMYTADKCVKYRILVLVQWLYANNTIR